MNQQEHIVKSFDSELNRLYGEIQQMGELAISQLNAAVDVLNRRDSNAAARIGRLAQTANKILADALKAYQTSDAELAAQVRDADAELDSQYTSYFRELLTYMMEDPRTIGQCTHLLFMAKNMERIGDHATNIAENTFFVVHGEMPEGERKKDDHTAE